MKNFKWVFPLIFLCISYPVFSQNLQNANWCFGNLARLNFNTLPPVATTGNLFLPSPGGSDAASVSDGNGNLLFSTNGRTVWDRTGVPMTNGSQYNNTQLYGSASNNTGSQYLAIIAKPSSPNKYYIFTTSSGTNNNAPDGHEGIYYSLVDMSLNAGNGNVVYRNIPLKDHQGNLFDYNVYTGSGVRPDIVKVTTTYNQARDGIWVVFVVSRTELGIPKLYTYSYLVQEDGIDNTADGSSPGLYNYTVMNLANYPDLSSMNFFGSIKISPDATQLCDATPTAVNLYGFNNQTGTVSFNYTVYNGTAGVDNAGYGAEFSPNSQFLYFTAWNHTVIQEGKPGLPQSEILIYQHQIGTDKSDVVGKFKAPGSSENLTPIGNALGVGLQLAIDNRIYVCVFDYQSVNLWGWLGIIQYPDLAAPACAFSHYGLQLSNGTNHWGSLPQWVHAISETWPKVYYGDKYVKLFRGTGSNIYMNLQLINFSPNLNHSGAIPTAPYGTALISHYNSANSRSGWTKSNQDITYVFASGKVQAADYTGGLHYVYYDGATGNTLSPPPGLPVLDKIITELAPGTHLSSYGYYPGVNQPPVTQYTISNAGGVISSVTLPGLYRYVKYNPNTKKMYIFQRNELLPVIKEEVNVYDLIGNTFVYVTTVQFAQGDQVVQVDNLDQVYVVHNGELKIINSTGVYTDIFPGIPGFNNSNIVAFTTNSVLAGNAPFTDNKCMVGNTAEGNLYVLDLQLHTQLHLATANFLDPANVSWSMQSTDYLIKDDAVYIAGTIFGSVQSYVTIGGQQINYLGTGSFSNFITKKYLLWDFQARNSATDFKAITVTAPPAKIQLLPNPATSKIRITIDESALHKEKDYQLVIFDKMHNPVLSRTRFLSGAEVDISVLQPGVYFVQLINRAGNIYSKSFIRN